MNKIPLNLKTTIYFLLIFMLILAAAIWVLDPVAQQRIFGFLMAAEFIALAMLVYIFYMEDPVVAKRLLTAGFILLAALILSAAAVFAGVGVPPKPNLTVTLYAGEVSMMQYGFGNTSSSITSPGPTLTFKIGDVVNMTVYNSGTMPHNWALTDSNQTSGHVLFVKKVIPGFTSAMR